MSSGVVTYALGFVLGPGDDRLRAGHLHAALRAHCELCSLGGAVKGWEWEWEWEGNGMMGCSLS